MRYAFFSILITVVAVTTMTCSSGNTKSTDNASSSSTSEASTESPACLLMQQALIKTARELTDERLAAEAALRQRGLDSKAIARVWQEVDSSQCARIDGLSKHGNFACLWMRSRPTGWFSLRESLHALSSYGECYTDVDHPDGAVAQAQ